MFDAMRFWLDRGVAGFRLDAIPTLFEDPQLRDEKVLGGTNAQGDPNLDDSMTNNLPEVHDVIRRMRTMVAAYPGDRVLIGETYLPNTAELDKWYGGAKKDELDLPMDMLLGFSNKLDAPAFRKYIEEAETQLHGSQPLFVFDNHDNPRSIDRYGDGAHNLQIAKLLASVLLTTRSTALMYYGEELGMATSTPTRREDVKDPIGITGWPREKGRDGERTPMQWDALNAQLRPAHLASRAVQLHDGQRRVRGEGSRLTSQLVRATHPSPPRSARHARRRDCNAQSCESQCALVYPNGSRRFATDRCRAEHVCNPTDSLAQPFRLGRQGSKREDVVHK